MRPGTIVAERFEVVRRARRGGMATIYRAIDRQSGAPVALKVLRGDDPLDAARFAEEAVTLAELRQPGIVEYVDHGHTADGSRFLVMEWLEGEDLATYLRRETPAVADAVRAVRGAADALAVAHERGLVHRDIKPGNLFLVDGNLDRVRVLDFGVALLQDTGMYDTPAGTTVGTPAYMAPEQARGLALDARADVFALGCVLFHCLAGRPPFVGDNAMAVMLKVVLEEPPRASALRPEVGAELDELIARTIDKRPDRRPANARALCDELDRIGRGGASPSARPRQPAITGGEQRLLSVVLVAGRRRRTSADGEGSGLFSGVDRVTSRFGGRLEQLADGSAAVVLEGRGAASDQAAHAARCALALRRVIDDAPIALATGRGELAARGQIVGEVIDRATMLLDLERSGARDGAAPVVRVDNVTAGLLDIRFEVAGAGFGMVLVAERDRPGLTRTLLGRPTPCLGRDRELRLLRDLFAECAEATVARAVVVTADAGVGKSRLRDELVRRLRVDHPDTTVLIGHGDPMRAGSAYGLLARAVRDAAGLVDGEPLPERRRKLRERLAETLRGGELARVIGFVGELAGVPFPDEDDVPLHTARRDPIVMGDQIQRAFLDWVGAETRRGPVLLVLEDLHWCDRPSVRLVGRLLSIARQPLLVLALARPEVQSLFPQLWRAHNPVELELGTLSNEACAALVREVLGDRADEALVRDLVARSAGNAFYLEELIRSVAEGHRGALPETVLAMVQARIEGLDAEARRILRAASVFGRVFWRGGVEVLLGGSESKRRVAGWLEELVRTEAITPQPVGALPDEEEYVFRHALLRDAAYRTLTAGDRELGHRLAGEWLEAVGERDAMVLAEHFERGGRRDSALRCYAKAAAQALEGNDFEAALARADLAIERGAAGDQLGALELMRAEAYRWLGAHPETLTSAVRAMALLPRGTIAWYGAAGLAATSAGNVGDAALFAVCDEVLAEEPKPGVAGPYVVALARAADRLLHAGHYDRADLLLERLAAVRAEVGGATALVDGWVHRVRAFRALFHSDPAGLLEEMIASENCFAEAGDLRYACMQRGNSGYGYMQLGAYEDAERVLREALAMAQRLGLGNVVTSVSVDLGNTLARLGRAEAGREMLRDAIRDCVRASNPRLEGPARVYLAWALERLGDLRGAEREARLAVEVLVINPPVRATALATLAAVLLRRQRSTEALSVAREAMKLLRALGGISESEGLVRLCYAEALDANGRFADSREAIEEARAQLLGRARRIERAEWREAFLSVREHARTVELADEWV